MLALVDGNPRRSIDDYFRITETVGATNSSV
ncbi:hypothetical protein ABIF99_009510 [Bradyrhizobium japonicum]